MKQLIKWGLAMIALTAISFSQLNAQTTHTLNPTDDVRLKNGISADTDLVIDARDGTRSFIRFDLSGLSGNVQSAELQLVLKSYLKSGSVDLYKCSSSNWNENTGFTDATAPTYNTSTDQLNTNTVSNFPTKDVSYTWILDVSKINTREAITIAIEKTGQWNTFYSSENTTNSPQLVLTVNDGGGGATCSDGVQNGDEEGVDCGGSNCPACPTCSDGIQNGDETGVDCGGTNCPACPTCDDGIQNGNETGVDCGGPDCPACPTCDDGIRNGDETGVDCGGSSCDPCEPSSGESVWTQDGTIIYYNTGNVGIGTTNPDALLTVAGQVLARRVTVTETAGGADFVFEKDYQLPPLEEVAAFVKKEKHLPEIPSAKEMEENGLDLAAFNIKLLQKVEELTLYLIEMQEVNKRQEEELKALREKVKTLEEK